MPACAASWLVHGIGPDNAQSTLIVSPSHWNRWRSSASFAATRSRRSGPGTATVPGTSARTARRARTTDPSARRTPTATPRACSTSVTFALVSMRPPNRRTSDAVSSPAPPRGTGLPTSCAEHRQQPAETRAAGLVRAQVRVHRVARQQHTSALAREEFLAQTTHRQRQHPREPQCVTGTGGPQQRQTAAHRWERAQQRAEDRVAHGLPARVLRLPRVGVRVREGANRLRGDLHVTRQQRHPVVRQHVRQHVRRVLPLHVQVQRAEHRRTESERVERRCRRRS